MEYRLLGPVELEGDGGIVPIGSAKQRALLAILLLHANEVVPQERLVEDLWGDEPPASAAHSLEVYVSRLRKTLHAPGSDGILASRGKGYVLTISPDRLDARRFERLVEEARALEPQQASALLRDALALWRGPALADVDLPGPARLDADRLDELRLVALEEQIEADIALGRQAAVVGEIQTLVAEHPLRERLRVLHMLALYGSGRQADALASYADAVRALRELGLEPSHELKDLQRRILVHDASLGQQTPVAPAAMRASRRRRRAWVVAAVVGAAIAAVATTVALSNGSGAELAAAPHSVGLYDPQSNSLVADLPIGGQPCTGLPGIAVGLGSVWVCDSDDGTLLRIDPRRRSVARTIGLGVTPASVAVGHGAVWVLALPAMQVIQLDRLGNIIRRVRLDNHPSGLALHSVPGSISSGPDAIWAVYASTAVAKIDPRTGRILHRTPELGGVVAQQALAQADAVWITGATDGVLVRLDPRSGAIVGTTPPAGGPTTFWLAETSGLGGIWVADFGEDAVFRVDPISRRPNAGVPVDHGAQGITLRDGAVWVSAFYDGTLDRIDPRTLQVTRRVGVGPNPVAIASGPGGVWITFE